MPHRPSSRPCAASSHARNEYSMCGRISCEQLVAATANRRLIGQVVLCGVCEEEDFVDDFVGLNMNIDDLCQGGVTFPGHQG